MQGHLVTFLLRKLTQLVNRPLGRILLALVILAGLGAYLAGKHFWAEYHFRIAKESLAKRDWAGAHAHLLVCLRVRPDDGRAHLLAARSCRYLEAYDEAEEHLKASRELGAIQDDVDLEWALLFAQRGDLKRVEGKLLACIKQNHPDTASILEALTRGYAQSCQLARAQECADLWVQKRPDHAEALFWRGRIKEEMCLSQLAMEDYGRAVELDPGHERARRRLAEHLVQSGQAEEALGHFECLARDQPDSVPALLGLARCHNELRQPNEALVLLDRLVATHPDDVQILVERGKAALQINQLAEAEEYLRRAVKLSPHEQTANSLLGTCLQQLGRRDEAKIFLAEADRIQNELQGLRKLMQQAAASPSDLSARYDIGMILLRNGHEQEGQAWLEGLLEIDPQHRPAHQALKEYYERQGNRTLADRHGRLAHQGR
jgi:tetratricopeptide (TPR) repeat protein